MAMIGLLIILLLLAIALLAPFLAPYDPSGLDLAGNLASPSLAHPLGQDKLGRDILSRILYGARVSVKVGVFTVGISLIIGLAVGSLAGYAGRWADEIIMRIVDILMAFPGILLAIAITAVLGPSLNHVILALCLTGWVGYARLIRGQILSEREREYVQAARSIGAGPLRILRRHILPNTLAPVIVEATFGMAGAILSEAGLSFLGLGTQPPTPSWGAMLNEGSHFLLIAPHLTIFPGLAIMLVVLGFNFLGDGLRDWMDVQIK
ncbi:MAG: ABC transporter permease [Deltaproteobacteria bacterium]|nr:ABC transporter permease [Deltaproteobacteria bacterium]